MRKIIVTEYLTLDGVMEDPGGAEKTPHGGWSFAYWNAEAAQYKFDELFAADALLLGRVTYQGFAQAWPSIQDDAGFADRMNHLPKFVVTKTLTALDWNNSHRIHRNILEEIRQLKAQPGRDILVAGSAQLVNELLRNGLVDEFRFLVHPVVLGGGKRLFQGEEHMKKLKLLETKTFPTGILLLAYRVENA
jgi:dihydrofolate reductase